MQDVIVSFDNRTAKCLCVTDVTGLLLACFVVIFTQRIYCARSVQISVDLLHKRSVSRTLFFKENYYHGFSVFFPLIFVLRGSQLCILNY